MDWSLFTGRGGASEVLPLPKKIGGGGGAAEKVLAMLKGGGGGAKSLEVVSTQELQRQ